MRAGRNDPCPCGSGKKYKHCCLAAAPTGPAFATFRPRFRFEAGSYGGPGRGYRASALCYEQTGPDEWREYYCLVSLTRSFANEDEASAMARADLEAAAAAKTSGGTDADFAAVLVNKGYIRLDAVQMARD